MRTHILAAACDILRRHGVAAVDPDLVAASAGIKVHHLMAEFPTSGALRFAAVMTAAN